MTTANTAEFHTLLDWNLLRAPDGSGEIGVARLMYQKNQFNQILPYREANDGVGHKIGIQTSLPPAFLAAYGQRFTAGHGTTAIVTEPTAYAKSPWSVLRDLAKLNGAGVELLKAAADHAEALAQLVEGKMIYGNHTTDPLSPNGFMLRHSSLTGEIGKYTIDGGGTASGSLSSIIVAGVGPGALFGLFPKGSMTAGIEAFDGGVVLDKTSAGELWKHAGEYTQYFGLAEEDHRFSVRIANISTVDLAAGTGPTLGLLFLIRDAVARIQSRMRLNIDPMGVNHYILMNSKVFRYLLHQTQTAVSQGAGITWENVTNGFVKDMKAPMCAGLPIIFSDQMLDGSEAAVS